MCFAWGWAQSDVCFVERPPTDDDFGVADLETAIWTTHATVDLEPALHDKFADNHYAVDMLDISADYLADTFAEHYDDIYPISPGNWYAFSCEQNYIIDPTGWSIQIDMGFSEPYPGCNATL